MIEKKEKKGNVTIYYVKKDYDDSKLNKVMNKKLKRSDIETIIDHDADVYTEDGNLLLRFRKNKLNKDNVKRQIRDVSNVFNKLTKSQIQESEKIVSNLLM